ncbi:general substrate transporter [Mrakia frigida]|uniref:sugar porter family MFS transporter n=1 Tax=Mrakia frigida TaxID=29902 RepID=UPI003FCC0CD5
MAEYQPLRTSEDSSSLPPPPSPSSDALKPPSQPKPSGWRGLIHSRQTLMISGFASLGGLCFGYDQGVVANVLVMSSFTSTFHLTPQQTGILTAILTLGSLFGSLASSPLADIYSRKHTLLAACQIFLLGSLIQTFSSSVEGLMVGRAVGGIGIGGMSMLSPLYLGEISEVGVRGTVLALEQLSIVFGVVLGFWIGFATRNLNGSISWRLPLLLQTIPSIILTLALLTLFPFSPRWLASQPQPHSSSSIHPGLETLASLRMRDINDYDVQEEWREILVEAKCVEEVRRERGKGKEGEWGVGLKSELSDWASLLSKGIRRRTLVGVGVMFFQQLSGINALLYYGPSILLTLGLPLQTSTLLTSGLINLIQLVATFPAILCIDSLGRRPLLITGAVGMTVAHAVLAGVVKRWDGRWGEKGGSGKVGGWLGVGCIWVFTAFYGSSFGPVGWVLPSEIFPSSVRAKGVALSTASNWITNFLIGLLTPPLLAYSPFLTYSFFSLSCLGAVGFAVFLVPETKGVGLEEMDEVFNDSTRTGWEDRERRRRVERELGYLPDEEVEDED